jgi:uncharacterized protein (TIGR02145 family)
MTIKSKRPLAILAICMVIQSFTGNAQNVGINTTGEAPHSSALLDLSATDKGFLITRAETSSIPSPAFGLMTLAPSDSCLYMFNGTLWAGIGGNGSKCICRCEASQPVEPPPPINFCAPSTTPVVDVINPTTGKTWMDRNLGASQVATSRTDALGYGGLYQWGRCTDGHEIWTNNTTTALSVTDFPGHNKFILSSSSASPKDWRIPQNDNLWQGINGINNPCPSGYRIPTISELNSERMSWTSNDRAGAFASPLKLPTVGKIRRNGSFNSQNSYGFYWSSTANGTLSSALSFTGSNSYVQVEDRAEAQSVRCIKN